MKCAPLIRNAQETKKFTTQEVRRSAAHWFILLKVFYIAPGKNFQKQVCKQHYKNRSNTKYESNTKRNQTDYIRDKSNKPVLTGPRWIESCTSKQIQLQPKSNSVYQKLWTATIFSDSGEVDRVDYERFSLTNCRSSGQCCLQTTCIILKVTFFELSLCCQGLLFLNTSSC